MQGEDRAQLLYERIADDERLRGDLEDDAYRHLLDWCARRASELGASTSEPDLDTLTGALRSAMRALVTAAASGNPAMLDGIPSTIAGASARRRAIAALQAAAPEPADRGRALADALGVESL